MPALRAAVPAVKPPVSLAAEQLLATLDGAASALEDEKRAAMLRRQQEREARGSAGASGSGGSNGGGVSGSGKKQHTECAACGAQAGAAGVKLRHCTGCSAVAYCGAAW